MNKQQFKVNPVHSLKFQLLFGAVGLLALTLTPVSYLLINYQKRILTHDLQNTIILQARNVALSSAKALFRSDPEFELVPLVTRIAESSDNITSLVITNSDHIVQADLHLQNVGQKLDLDPSLQKRAHSDLLASGEALFEDKASFSVRTPVTSLDKIIGYVYMGYSKHELIASIRRAMTITLVCGAAAFGLGVMLSLMIFRRISNPLDVVVRGVNSLGQGNLSTRITLTTKNEFRFLAQSFNSMASKLLSAQAELVAKELMDRELEIAHDIQGTLIPDNVRQPHGYEIGIYYKAATQVGGDYVDVIRVDGNHIAFVMADVSGKGIPGLVVMAMLKIMVHELVRKGMSPVQIVRKLNVSLAANVRKNMFVTMLLGILDTNSGELVYSNAAHNPIILYSHAKRRCRVHRIKGRPLAIFSDQKFCERLSEHRVTLEPDDLFLLYTDGLNESRDHDLTQFGFKRIADVCEKYAHEGANPLVERLVIAEARFRGDSPQADDLTLLAVRAAGSEAKPPDTVHVLRAE